MAQISQSITQKFAELGTNFAELDTNFAEPNEIGGAGYGAWSRVGGVRTMSSDPYGRGPREITYMYLSMLLYSFTTRGLC